MEARSASANGLNNTRQLDPEYGRQLKRKGISNVALTDFPIDAVHPGGANSDQNLSRSGLRLIDLGYFGGVGAAVRPNQYSALCGAHLQIPRIGCDDYKIGRCMSDTKTRK
jgi:hypothetical protein